MHLQFGPQSFWVQKEDAGLVPATNASIAAAQYNNEVAKLQSIATEPVAPPAPDIQTIHAIVAELAGPLRDMIRQELAKTAEARRQEFANAFPVDASSDAWQNSGVRVNAGQRVLVQAVEGDKWDLGWGPIDAKGYPYTQNAISGVPVYHTGKADDDWHWGALICAVGDGRNELEDPGHQIEVGTRREFTVDEDGYVYLMANDNRQLPDGRNGFDDNSGVIHVRVTVSDPEPAHLHPVMPTITPDTKADDHPGLQGNNSTVVPPPLDAADR
jgi:hypothetical protein